MIDHRQVMQEMRKVLKSLLRSIDTEAIFSQAVIDQGYLLLRLVDRSGPAARVLRRLLHAIDHFGTLTNQFLAEARQLART